MKKQLSEYTYATVARSAFAFFFGVLSISSTVAVGVGTDVSASTVGGKWTQVATGGDFVCALSSGDVYCRGDNDGKGILGTNAITKSKDFLKIGGALAGKEVSQIGAGYSHACALADGEVYCWGDNSSGELGIGSTQPTAEPTKVIQAPGVLQGKYVTQLAADFGVTCAIAAGEAYCWGYNPAGGIGTGTAGANVTSPAKVVQQPGFLAGKTVTSISPGSRFTCAVADGEVFCWGANNIGQLGDGTNVGKLVPVKVVQDAGVLASKTVAYVTSGYDTTCVFADSEAYCWGANYNGQYGVGDWDVESYTPLRISPAAGLLQGKKLSMVTSAESGTCATIQDEMYCWGDNNYGNVGDGTQANIRLSPARVLQGDIPSGAVITQISGSEWYGGEFTCAIADDELYCWGANYYDQLGVEGPDNQLTPLVTNHIFNSIDTIPDQPNATIEKRPTFSGTALPGSTVVVTVRSDPIVCTTTADSNGNWSCTLPSDVPAGNHTVTVVITDTGNNVTTLGPFSVVVAAGPTQVNGEVKAPNSGEGLSIDWTVVRWLLAIICVALLGSTGLRLDRRR